MGCETCGDGSESGEPLEIADVPFGTDKIQVGTPYSILAPAPEGLALLLAYFDRRLQPLQVCGSHGLGEETGPFGDLDIDENINDFVPITPNPIDGTMTIAQPPYDPHPLTYGIKAHGCTGLNCVYTLGGTLGAHAIVGKIDGRWNILRVLASAQTSPLFSPSNNCRCCGYTTNGQNFKAVILAKTVPAAGDYEVCDEFNLNPILDACEPTDLNPLQISISCNASESSEYEDASDWIAFAGGVSASVLSIACCGGPTSCDGSGSGSGSGDCRFEAVIQTAEINGTEYTILIYVPDDPEEPCEQLEDVPIATVKAHACGLDLEVGDRLIVVRIPGGVAGVEALEGGHPVEWFVIRACTDQACANPCDPPPPEPVGPPCCGKLCSEHPNTLTATIEIINPTPDCECEDPVTLLLTRIGNEECDGAANTRWSLAAPVPDGTFCPGLTTDPEPGPFPKWLDIETMQLTCGTADDVCGDEISVDGPDMELLVSGGLTAGPVEATQDLLVSCCDPLYLEYEVTDQFCIAAGAGTLPDGGFVTLRITITE